MKKYGPINTGTTLCLLQLSLNWEQIFLRKWPSLAENSNMKNSGAFNAAKQTRIQVWSVKSLNIVTFPFIAEKKGNQRKKEDRRIPLNISR